MIVVNKMIAMITMITMIPMTVTKVLSYLRYDCWACLQSLHVTIQLRVLGIFLPGTVRNLLPARGAQEERQEGEMELLAYFEATYIGRRDPAERRRPSPNTNGGTWSRECSRGSSGQTTP